MNERDKELANQVTWYADVTFTELSRFAAIIRADEREACAKACDEYDIAEDVNSSDTAEGIALAIRARENK